MIEPIEPPRVAFIPLHPIPTWFC